MKAFKTREELLQNTIDYYWGLPERQCIDSSGTCMYSAIGTSDGCAIGRHIDPILSAKLDELNHTDTTIGNPHVFDSLPIWLQKFGKDFLVELQHLHDLDFLSNCNDEAVYTCMKPWVNFDLIKFPKK